MRRTVRIVLSSYVVVLAACSSALSGAPSPAGQAGGVMQQGGPARALATAPIRFNRARVGAGDTLSVEIQGPSAVKAPGSGQFSAAVRNGRGARYYYWWFVASCAKGAGCAPSSYHLAAEGEDRTTLAVPFGAQHAERDIIVQVAEIDGDGQTGSSAQFAVMGPAPRGTVREKVSGGICDWYAGSFYPHRGLYTDPYSGRTWERGFRRDYCRNQVSWEPTGIPRSQT
jgi:hypothetical protein